MRFGFAVAVAGFWCVWVCMGVWVWVCGLALEEGGWGRVGMGCCGGGFGSVFVWSCSFLVVLVMGGELGREEGANGFWVCKMVKRGD